MRLIVARPLEDAKRMAAKLERLGHEPLVHPLMEVRFPPLPPLDLANIQALIVTSRNALRALSKNASFAAARSLPCYCVGEGTASLAVEFGFSHVHQGTGTGKELFPLIIEWASPSSGTLLYLTGDKIAFDLEAPLRDAGFSTHRLVIYEACEVADDEKIALTQTIEAGVDGVILMSPRTAELFLTVLKTCKLVHQNRTITCYCISGAVAKPLRNQENLVIAVASHPTEAAMMTLIETYHR